MPELPEVETVVRTLEYKLKNPIVVSVDVFYSKIIDNVGVEEFKRALINQRIESFERLGKYLVFRLSDYYLISHMRMEGKFFVEDKDTSFDKKHTHIVIHLQNGIDLRYHDTRKFGRMYLYPIMEDYSQFKCFQHVGYDVFDQRLHSIDLYKRSRNRTITLKQFLLDQRNLAGIGNIYADEICFRCKLHPESKIYKLSKKDFEHILEASRVILAGAIKAGGTTIRSYTSQLGVDGRFQLQLKVHQRKGEACYICSEVIQKIVVGGRGTYICSKCQKKK